VTASASHVTCCQVQVWSIDLITTLVCSNGSLFPPIFTCLYSLWGSFHQFLEMLHCQLLFNNCTFKNLDLIKKWFLTWLEHEKFTISEQFTVYCRGFGVAGPFGEFSARFDLTALNQREGASDSRQNPLSRVDSSSMS
jgi:hypothetical protein